MLLIPQLGPESPSAREGCRRLVVRRDKDAHVWRRAENHRNGTLYASGLEGLDTAWRWHEEE